MLRALVISGLLAAAAAACTFSALAPQEASFLRAAVRGAVVESYEGTASFHVGTPGPGRQQFQISSYGDVKTGPSFALTRWDGGRLAVGNYPLRLVDLAPYLQGEGVQPRGITLQYFHTGEDFEAQFVAHEGVLEITHSSRDRIEGRFNLTGERYCLRERVRSNPPMEPVGPCTPPSTRIGDVPEIHVSGTFSATPLRLGPIEMR
jgi:hypothetical protein